MVFIIGGRGLVGSAFVRACEASGRPYAILDRQTYPHYVGQHCSVLINANGSSRKPLASERPLDDFDQSVRSVRQSLIDFHFERYIHLSSCDVYSDCSSPESTREDRALDPARQSPYGFHKFLAEQCVMHAAPQWLVFRLGGFVGPGLKKNAIYDILQGGPLWLDPKSELQFMHTDDAARIMLELTDRGLTREIVNLCGRGTIALQDVMCAAGKAVQARPGSRSVRYDVSIEKVSGWIEVPSTRETVLEFVRSQR